MTPQVCPILHATSAQEDACEAHNVAALTALHPAVSGILRWFESDHLPEYLQLVVRPIRDVAHLMARTLTGTQLTHGLYELLHAKDAFVRAAVEGADGE